MALATEPQIHNRRETPRRAGGGFVWCGVRSLERASGHRDCAGAWAKKENLVGIEQKKRARGRLAAGVGGSGCGTIDYWVVWVNTHSGVAPLFALWRFARDTLPYAYEPQRVVPVSPTTTQNAQRKVLFVPELPVQVCRSGSRHWLPAVYAKSTRSS
jgi:hypothetical protein